MNNCSFPNGYTLGNVADILRDCAAGMGQREGQYLPTISFAESWFKDKFGRTMEEAKTITLQIGTDVFNSELRHWKHMLKAVKYADAGGYRFIIWKGKVYRIHNTCGAIWSEELIK